MSDMTDGSQAKNLEMEPLGKPEVSELPPGDKPRWFGTWVGQAPDKYKQDESYLDDLLKHKNIGEVLDRMYAAEEKLYKELQIPESPEGYEFVEVEFPEHLKGDESKQYREAITTYFTEITKAIRELAHKNGWSKESAQEAQALFVKQVFEQEQAARDAFEKAKTDGLDILKKDWKGNFNPNIEMCRRTIATFDDGSLVADLEAEGGLVNKPSLIKFLYKVSQAMGEGVLVPGSTTPTELSPEAEKQHSLRNRYNRSPEMFE